MNRTSGAGEDVPAGATAGAASRVYIGLGANLGDPAGTLDAAEQALRALPGCTWVAASRRYRSAPVGTEGPEFLNAVVALDVRFGALPDSAVQSTLDASTAAAAGPLRLLRALQAIELAHGRERPYRWAPRTLDLDLLLVDDRVIDTPELTLPHPRLAQRAFVVRPLLELAPGLHVPGVGGLAAVLPALADQAIEPLG